MNGKAKVSILPARPLLETRAGCGGDIHTVIT